MEQKVFDPDREASINTRPRHSGLLGEEIRKKTKNCSAPLRAVCKRKVISKGIKLITLLA